MNHKHIRKTNKSMNLREGRASRFFHHVLVHPETINSFLKNDGDGIMVVLRKDKYDFIPVRGIQIVMNDYACCRDDRYIDRYAYGFYETSSEITAYGDGSRITFDDQYFR